MVVVVVVVVAEVAAAAEEEVSSHETLMSTVEVHYRFKFASEFFVLDLPAYSHCKVNYFRLQRSLQSVNGKRRKFVSVLLNSFPVPPAWLGFLTQPSVVISLASARLYSQMRMEKKLFPIPIPPCLFIITSP